MVLRATFNEVADLYDGRRPPVPGDLFDRLVEMTGVPSGGRVLEVGPGTGRATGEMARRGLHVVGVELGQALADVARGKLAKFPNVEIVTADFDYWDPEGDRFDVVMAVGAWHWLDPRTRTKKAAAVLAPGGAVAIVDGAHVTGSDTELFGALQRCYDQHDPPTDPAFRLPDADHIPPNDWGLSDATEFGGPVFRRWITEVEYSTESYLSLINTFSGTIALAPERRQALLDCISQLIDAQNGGRIRRTQMFELCVARKA